MIRIKIKEKKHRRAICPAVFFSIRWLILKDRGYDGKTDATLNYNTHRCDT